MAYTPTPPPSGELQMSQLMQWLIEEFKSISLASNAAVDTPMNTELHEEPRKPRDGMIVYADGTNWNPGSGKGFYGRENGAWVKL